LRPDSNDGAISVLVKTERESVPSPKVCDGKLERRRRNSDRVKIDKMTLKCYPVNRRNKSMRVLDDKGNIAEPTSRNWGKPPDPDSKSEQKLLRWGWVWLLIPIMGAIPYSMVRRELTNRWGHRPWWL
jgi:hypothetical protein